MKILQTLDCYYPKFDGPTNVITNYGKSLKKVKNAEVDVYVPRFPKYKDDQPFKVVRVKSVRSADGYYQGMPGIDGKLKKTLKENKYDVIHIHSPFTMGRFFARYGKKHGIPTVFTFHTKFKEDFVRILHAKPLVGFMMRYIMTTVNACDHVLTVSDGAAEVLRSYGYKKEITVIRNGTDLVYPANAAELAAQVEEKHALAGQKNVFLSVGRIVENKRLDLVLDALKIVKERGVDFRFLVVGDGSYKEKLENKAKDLALADRVIFTGKVMDRALAFGLLSQERFIHVPLHFRYRQPRPHRGGRPQAAQPYDQGLFHRGDRYGKTATVFSRRYGGELGGRNLPHSDRRKPFNAGKGKLLSGGLPHLGRRVRGSLRLLRKGDRPPK